MGASAHAGPRQSLGPALAQLEWRVCTGPLAKQHPGQTGRGWLPGAGRRAGPGEAPTRMGMLPTPSPPGDPARCCRFRGEASKQVQNLRQVVSLQILLPTLPPPRSNKEWQLPRGFIATAQGTTSQASSRHTCVKAGL